MTTQEVATSYYDLFKQRRVPEIYAQFYSPHIVCTEPEHALAMGVPTITRGLEAVLAKSKERQELIAEVHSFFCSEPVVGGDFFSVAMGRDMSFKNGQRVQLSEIAVFGVKEGKIVSETFFISGKLVISSTCPLRGREGRPAQRSRSVGLPWRSKGLLWKESDANALRP